MTRDPFIILRRACSPKSPEFAPRPRRVPELAQDVVLSGRVLSGLLSVLAFPGSRRTTMRPGNRRECLVALHLMLLIAAGCEASARSVATVTAHCGNNRCEPSESPALCPKDCSDLGTALSQCGDDRCDADEHPGSCPADCKASGCMSSDGGPPCPEDCSGALLNKSAAGSPIATGLAHSCAIKRDGSVWCWGSNAYGQLGNGKTRDSHAAVQVLGLKGAAGISLGVDHSCARKEDGGVWCWGSNWASQLGDGKTKSRHSPIPVQVATLVDVVALSAGSSYTCAIKEDRSTWCWGYNQWGQLGDGTTTTRPTPVRVVNLEGAASIAAGSSHTCALKTDASLWCWGDNSNMELGADAKPMETRPHRVLALPNVGGITTGGGQGYGWTCALRIDGHVSCMGKSLGADGLMQIPEISQAISISSGGAGTHICAIKTDRTAWCMGLALARTRDILGNGKKVDDMTVVQVRGLFCAAHIAAGFFYSCSAKSDWSIWCWGINSAGQLGNSDQKGTNQPTPVRVSGF